MITFYKILTAYGFTPASIKLVRHGNKEIDVLNSFRNNLPRFEAYQSFMLPNKFGQAEHIAVFAPDRGTTALFLGLWDIKSHIPNDRLSEKLHATIDKYSFPKSWHKRSAWYQLLRNPIMDDLSERLVIDWRYATRAWVQAKDKPVVEIKAKNSIGDFVSYDDVQLNYDDLKKLMKDADSNVTWVNALSSVNGIYLIRDKSSGKLYVGSAYGENGIYGRWISYAKSGHGGNDELRTLDTKNFEFAVLEITPKTLSPKEVIQHEIRWKERLGTREFGLNSLGKVKKGDSFI